MNSKKLALPKPLTPTDGNRRKSSRVKPSDKAKENNAQQEEGIIVHEDGTILVADASEAMDTADEGQGEDITPLMSNEWYIKAIYQQNVSSKQQNDRVMQILLQVVQENKELKARVEALETRLHQRQELASTGGALSYAGAAMLGAKTMTPQGQMGPPRLAPRVEEIFCTVDYSRVGVEEEAAIIPDLRKDVKKEIQKEEGKAFRCKAILKDPRARNRVRILCRNEEELDKVKKAATKIAKEGVRVLWDQLYPVKVNNVRTDAVLQPSGELREDTIAALEDGNNTQVAKVSWLSSRHTRKAYGSTVVFLKKGSEAERFLQEEFINVSGESAYVRVFEPNFGPPRCYNCQGTGHKAFSCREPQRCGRCAQVGHSMNDCSSEPKCAKCSGSHSVSSRTCPMLYGL